MNAKTFITKPMKIEAIQFTSEDCLAVREFAMDSKGNYMFIYGYNKDEGRYAVWGKVYAVLHHTWINVYEGQWIVRSAKGEFYPCDNETFWWKYEESS